MGRRYIWKNELWAEGRFRSQFSHRRALSRRRHGGTIKAAERNYLLNREELQPVNDFLLIQ